MEGSSDLKTMWRNIRKYILRNDNNHIKNIIFNNGPIKGKLEI